MQEQGLERFEVNSWYGVCAPAGTPGAVLDRLNADINAVLNAGDVRQRLLELITEVTPGTREQFDQFIRGEVERWAKVIKEAGIPKQ